MHILRDNEDVNAKRKGGHSEKGTTCKPRRVASGETKPADILIWDLQPPSYEKKRKVLFKPGRLWHAGTTLRTN